MDKEAMKQLILESLTQKPGSGCHISIRKVLKTNQKLDGLTILQDGKNITPTIYLEPFYGELEKGAAPDDVTDAIIQLYFSAEAGAQGFDVTPIADFDYVKSRLFVQLINRHSNTELLQGIPHSLFLDDFAVVVRCLVRMASEEHADFLVHDNHLNLWDIDSETLLSTAIQNTREMSGVNILDMNGVLQELSECPCVDICSPSLLWVMSNRQRLYGAAKALFDDVLKEFAETHGSFYVIFSSIHEILLIPMPARWDPDRDQLTEMNMEVNKTQVRQDEILGTHAYLYDKEKGFVQ